MATFQIPEPKDPDEEGRFRRHLEQELLELRDLVKAAQEQADQANANNVITVTLEQVFTNDGEEVVN